MNATTTRALNNLNKHHIALPEAQGKFAAIIRRMHAAMETPVFIAMYVASHHVVLITLSSLIISSRETSSSRSDRE
jgi:hypothetical protein